MVYHLKITYQGVNLKQFYYFSDSWKSVWHLGDTTPNRSEILNLLYIYKKQLIKGQNS